MKEILQQIERIKDKLNRVSKTDKHFKLFGSESHKYKLNKTLTEKEIVEFENNYSIRLPDEYRFYLQHISNGGAGPYYGIQKLSDSIFEDLDYKKTDNRVNPSKTFPHLTAWNINLDDFDSNEEYEKAYFAKQHSNGLLRLCNFGCGISINLIVNGVEYGNMWADDRGNDNGIAPWLRNNKERLNFLNWYELWLDESIEKLKL